MYELYTERARRTLALMQENARSINHDYMGTEHLLLALIQEGEGVAASALDRLAVTYGDARDQVLQIIGPGSRPPKGHIPFTPRVKLVMELSLAEAQEFGHAYIGTEHLLLALVRERSGVAAQVLTRLGVSFNDVREATRWVMHGGRGLPWAPAPPSASRAPAAPAEAIAESALPVTVAEAGAVAVATRPTGTPAVLPVRAESTAILLGAGRFRDPDLGDVPAVTHNLLDLSTALGGADGLFDAARVHHVDQLEHHDLGRIDDLARDTADTLLLYYSGHGINAADDLYLAYASTDPARPQLSALGYDKLRHIVLGSPARRCLIILDCCYAGKAIGWLSGGAVPGGELDVRGSYLLTATAATVKALAPEHERNSAFTAAILRLLREGVDNGSKYIQVQELHPLLHADLRSRSLPLPRQRPVDTIGNLAFARNPRWRAA